MHSNFNVGRSAAKGTRKKLCIIHKPFRKWSMKSVLATVPHTILSPLHIFRWTRLKQLQGRAKFGPQNIALVSLCILLCPRSVARAHRSVVSGRIFAADKKLNISVNPFFALAIRFGPCAADALGDVLQFCFCGFVLICGHASFHALKIRKPLAYAKKKITFFEIFFDPL